MFKFKNISSEAMKVIAEEEYIFLTKPELVTNDNFKLDDNDLNEDNYTYENVSSAISLFILDKQKIDEIKQWLNGIGELEYNGRVTTVIFSNDYEVVRSSTIYKINPNFIRLPFWFKANDDFIISENEIINEGNTYSYPIIRLEKQTTNKIDITINDVTFVYNFPEDEDYVEIDCSKGNAKYDGFYRNSNLEISWKFPKLNPGLNKLIVNAGDSIVKIKRKDCWL